ncbi:MAG: S8/S53 family peptidase [Chitinophagaceae bacterium]
MEKIYPVNALLIEDAAPSGSSRQMTAAKAPSKIKAGDLEFTLQPYNNISNDSSGANRSKGFTGSKPRLSKAILTTKTGTTHPWDLAHHAREHNKDLQLKFVEPDLIHVNETSNAQQVSKEVSRSFGNKDAPGLYDEEWPHPTARKIWHNENDFTQLKQAREAVMNLNATVRIAHLDTGYIKEHSMLPEHIRTDLERSFGHDDDNENDASDRGNPIFNGIGHGTSTMLLLAGRKINYPDYNFNDYLGGAPWAEIVPVRVSRSVVLLSTSSFVEAMDYVIGLSNNPDTHCDIVTMSMGGLPTKAWATAVNAAYDNGIFITTASGDNTGGLPTRRTVYPARFRRVVNVTGVCYDYTPYYHGNIFHTQAVQGNFGPSFLMNNAIASYSPNVPWIIHDKDNNVPSDKIGLGGAGTSASTPQVAAAAANYIRKHYDDLKGLAPWQKVEAVRTALFKKANKTKLTGDDLLLYFGNGTLQAFDALSEPVNAANYTMQPEDDVKFALFHMLFRAIKPATSPADDIFEQMIEVEMLQLVNSNSRYQDLLEPVQYNFIKLPKTKKKEIIDGIIGSNTASDTLKTFLKTNYNTIINSKA